MLVIEEKINNWKWKYPKFALTATEAAQTAATQTTGTAR
jgi:hypothetical protein